MQEMFCSKMAVSKLNTVNAGGLCPDAKIFGRPGNKKGASYPDVWYVGVLV